MIFSNIRFRRQISGSGSQLRELSAIRHEGSACIRILLRPKNHILTTPGAAAAAGGSDDGWYMTGNTGGIAEDFARRRRFRELVASLSRQRSCQLR